MRNPFATPSPERAPGFTDFVAARSAPLLAVARGLARSDADAADLVQDVLARALLRWDAVSGATDPAAYVNRMLVNAAVSSWRRGTRRERATPDDQLAASLDGARTGSARREARDPAEAVVERDALLRALRSLPPRHRAVLVLRFYEGMPDAEIAALLDVAQATVRSSAARGLLALRRAGLLDDPVDAAR